MGLKTILEKITPPVVIDVYRRVWSSPTWKGVYPHVKAVPATGLKRRGEGWRPSAVDPRAYERLPADALQEHDLLALVAAVACRENGGSLRVVDFGGGLGIAYVHLLNRLRDCRSIEYHVVELEWACAEGSRLFEQDRRIRFHQTLPAAWPGVDILYAHSSIQYVEDYVGVLETLCGYRARYVLLVDVHAGDFPTYATAERKGGVVVPVWLVNRNEIVNIVSGGGYDLLLDTPLRRGVDQSNFPRELRLPDDRCRVLLFARRQPARP